MDITTLASLIALFYGAIYFIDQLLKSCMNLPYLYFLENLGIRIQPFQIHVFATIFNRPLAKLWFLHKRCFKAWFSVGAVCVLLLLFPAVFMLVKNLVSQLSTKVVDADQQLLQPMLPGVNLPIDEFPYYFFTLLIVSIIHEAGHAIAAIGEDVHMNGIGFMLLYALPGAYVDLSKEGLHKLPPFRQLKILCAGVWHNLVLVVIAFVIGTTLPYTLSPFYYYNSGIHVLGLDKNSLARGPKGLNPGDIIEGVNFCPVANVDDWRRCLIRNAKKDQIGFCIPGDIVNKHDETIQHASVHPDGSVECCENNEGNSLCFELQLDDTKDLGETPMQPYSCLPARIAVSASSGACVTPVQCPDEKHFCLAPSLNNGSRLLLLSRRSKEKQDPSQPGIQGRPIDKDVLFLGKPSHIYFSVTVTNYIPKYPFFPSSLPRVLEMGTDYMVKFSGALGVLNLIPCVYLDGYWISGALIDLVLASYVDLITRRIIHITVTIFGTLLLVTTIAMSIWAMT